MIENFNRMQVVKAVIAAVLSVLALCCTLAFFYYGPLFVMYNLGIENRATYALVTMLLLTAVVLVVGYRRGKQGLAHYGFEDSGMHVQMDIASGGTFMTQLYAQRVTTPAYLLGQLFLGAPLQALKAKHLWTHRIPEDHGLEMRLTSLLGEMQAVDKWEDAKVYEDQWPELRYLIRMDKAEYSEKRGRVRVAKKPF